MSSANDAEMKADASKRLNDPDDPVDIVIGSSSILMVRF